MSYQVEGLQDGKVPFVFVTEDDGVPRSDDMLIQQRDPDGPVDVWLPADDPRCH